MSIARNHAKYSGSNAHRFPNCAGQVRLAATVPPLPESPDAAAGTAAHRFLDHCIQYGVKDAASVAFVPPVPDAWVKAVQECIDYVETIREQYPDVAVFSELYVMFPQHVVPGPDAAGYVDIFMISIAARKAWVIDFKNGVGEVVQVRGNPQPMFYAAGATWGQDVHEVTLVIIQPNSYMDTTVSEHTVTAYDLVEFAADIEEAIERAELPDAPLTPGEWCHWCAAGVVCKAREAYALAHVETVTLPQLVDGVDMERVSYVLSRADALREWLKEVENFAYAKARNGADVPGYKLVEAQGRRRWDVDNQATAQKLSGITDFTVPVDDFLTHKLIGITEAEKKLTDAAKADAPKGKKTEAAAEAKLAMAFLTTKDTSGNLTLVPVSDKRPAWRGAAANFSGVTIEVAPEHFAGVTIEEVPERPTSPPLYPGVQYHEPDLDNLPIH